MFMGRLFKVAVEPITAQRRSGGKWQSDKRPAAEQTKETAMTSSLSLDATDTVPVDDCQAARRADPMRMRTHLR
jgi:hypothetical protein